MATVTHTLYRTHLIEEFGHGVFVTHRDDINAGFWVEDLAAAKIEIDLLNDPQAVEVARQAEERLVTEEFCFICSRCTDHRGEHSMVQLTAAKYSRA